MSNIKVGDYVVCIDKQYFGVSGIVIKKYFPTACEEQTMIKCSDGRQFHAPTRLFERRWGVMAKCWKYKLLIKFCKPYHIPVCCVGCKRAKNNQCTKHTRTPKERGADKAKITCLNCKHFMFSDMYGECNKQLKIVNPSDTCEYAEPKEGGEE